MQSENFPLRILHMKVLAGCTIFAFQISVKSFTRVFNSLRFRGFFTHENIVLFADNISVTQIFFNVSCVDVFEGCP